MDVGQKCVYHFPGQRILAWSQLEFHHLGFYSCLLLPSLIAGGPQPCLCVGSGGAKQDVAEYEGTHADDRHVWHRLPGLDLLPGARHQHIGRYIQRIVQDAIHHPSQFLKMPVGAKTLLMYSLPLLFIDWKIRRDTRDVVYFKNKIVVNIILFITIYFLLQQIVLKENTSFIYFQF